MQNDGIDDREQARTSGDADGQNQDRSCGETAVAPEIPRGVLEILRQIGEHARSL